MICLLTVHRDNVRPVFFFYFALAVGLMPHELVEDLNSRP